MRNQIPLKHQLMKMERFVIDRSKLSHRGLIVRQLPFKQGDTTQNPSVKCSCLAFQDENKAYCAQSTSTAHCLVSDKCYWGPFTNA